QTFNWGLRDTGTNTLQMLPAQSVGTVSGGAVFELGLEMPATFNPTNTKLRLDCSYCYFKNIQFIQWPLEYFVTQRTVTAQPTSLVSTYTYQYDNPAPNTDATSAAAAANGILYTNKLREFRGNSMSEVVDPAGTATLTWFNQSDALKGKPYDNLVMQQSFYDSLDTINSNWVATGGTQVVATNYQIDYDNNVQSYNSAANWNVSFARAASTLTSGKMAIARVRLSGANAQGEAGLLSGSGQFFGVTLSAAGGAVLQNGATLIPAASFKLDTWYVVMFFVDDSNGFRARIWDANNPSVSGEAVVSMAGGQAWKFRERINNGTQSLGLYIEGTPYTETITNYASTLQYDTVTGNGIPDLAASGLMTYTDLQVAWNYPTSTERRNYNGGSAFVGTKQVYAYATQYGNVTSTTDYSGNNGSWTAYRATQTEYYPNATTYVVSLPARQVTFACAADCTTNRVSESLNFYDSNTAYTGQPTKGELTTQRAWVQNSDYSQVSYTYDSFGNRQTQSVYTGYGTASAAPDATTRQWTFTTYDTDGYNTYATTVANNLKQGMQTSYNYALGLPVSLTDPNGAVTSATYDGFGRIKTITAPYDSSATLQVAYYDTRIPFQIDLTQAVNGTASIRLSRFYDGAGRQIQTQTVGAVVNGTQKNVVVDDQYNSLGQLVKQTAPYAIAYNGTPAFSTQNFSNPYTSTSYDAIGRTLSVTAPNGNQTNYIYTRLTSTVTDPKQNATTTTVDVWGRTTLIHPPTGPDVSYTYDVLNRLTKATRAGYDTIIQYDALGRKLNMSDPDMGYWQYQYDAVGNLKVQTDARGCILSLGYDSLNRLQSKASTGSCGQQITLNYYYDADDPITPAYDPPRYINTQIGRRTGMSDGSGQTAWTYDLRGRLTQEAKGIIGASLFTTSWTYNSADLPVTMT
ncbi:MAG: RHS repeat protein, partial [Chloroflexi bacterium]|nr:RHS repeat protein [Chloroflexota bacterium]